MICLQNLDFVPTHYFPSPFAGDGFFSYHNRRRLFILRPMSELHKESSTYGESASIGAGGGAAVGALATLLQENPSLLKALKNATLGALTGAAVGAGVRGGRDLLTEKVKVEGSTSEAGPLEEIPAPAAEEAPGKEPTRMSLPIAALTGLAPGIAPAIHGAVATKDDNFLPSLGQTGASAAASLAGPTLVARNQLLKGIEAAQQGRIRPMSGRARLAMPLTAILGATGAAAAGNALRDQ